MIVTAAEAPGPGTLQPDVTNTGWACLSTIPIESQAGYCGGADLESELVLARLSSYPLHISSKPLESFVRMDVTLSNIRRAQRSPAVMQSQIQPQQRLPANNSALMDPFHDVQYATIGPHPSVYGNYSFDPRAEVHVSGDIDSLFRVPRATLDTARYNAPNPYRDLQEDQSQSWE